MITLEHVTKLYDDNKHALDNVSLHIAPGEFVFIVGDSGAGKSTLFKLLTSEIKPTKGEIFVDGMRITRVKHRKVAMLRRKFGVVFQDFRLLKDRNVYENVAIAQRVTGVPANKIQKNVTDTLTLVGIAEKYKSLPNQLSGGEQQRVSLARAIVNRPKILLADEPTGNLDPSNTQAIMDILMHINRMGTTVVVVTHDHDMVRQYNKRVINLKKGKVANDIQEGGLAHEE